MRSPRAAWRQLRTEIAQDRRRDDLARANALRKAGRYDDSRHLILRSLRRTPDDEWLQRVERGSRYAQDEDRALRLFDEGQTDEGIAAMQRLADEWADEADCTCGSQR